MKVLKIVWLVVFIGLGCLLSGCSETEADKHFRQEYEYHQQGKLEEAIASYQKTIDTNLRTKLDQISTPVPRFIIRFS